MHTTLAFISGPTLLWAGLLFGFVFGVLLHRGGVTDYNVIVKQFLFRDFTVLKVMLSAVIVGMIGFHLLRHFGLAELHAAEGTVGSNVIGGLIFSTVLTLLIVPGTFSLAIDVESWLGRKFGRFVAGAHEITPASGGALPQPAE